MSRFRLFATLVATLVATLLAALPVSGQDHVALECRGHLVPGSQVTVCPQAAGHVVELHVQEGRRVKAGEVLARLDSEGPKRELALALAKLRLAEAEHSKAKEAAVRADVVIAEARVAVARAEVAVAEHRFEGTVVRAPIDGVVTALRAGVGTRIDPRAAQLPASLCNLADVRAMEVEVWVPERDIAKVAVGQQCVVRVDALPNATYRAAVNRLLPVSDRARTAVAVRVRLEVPSEHLRSELTAVVSFIAKE